MKAAEDGDTVKVRRLLSKGHEIDEKDDVMFYHLNLFALILNIGRGNSTPLCLSVGSNIHCEYIT
jgi:hypothetical protein